MERGVITWGLPYTMRYIPNSSIPVSISVQNPDVLDHEYSLVMIISQAINGVVHILHQQPMLVDGQEWFPLVSGTSRNFDTVLASSIAGVDLGVYLKEKKINNFVGHVSVALLRGMATEDLANLMMMNLIVTMMGGL